MVATEKNTTERPPSVPHKPAALSLQRPVLKAPDKQRSDKAPPPLPRRPSVQPGTMGNPLPDVDPLRPRAFPSHRMQKLGPTLPNHLNIPRGSPKLKVIAMVDEFLFGIVTGNLTKWSIASGSQLWSISLASDACLSIAQVSSQKLALGMHSGMIWIVDVLSGTLLKKLSRSGNPIWHLMGVNDELVSIDDAGWVHSWKIVEGDIAPENKTGVTRVMERPYIVKVAGDHGLWIALGTLFEMNTIHVGRETNLLARFDLVNDLKMESISPTVGLFSLPPDAMISVHEEGQVVFWNDRECRPMETFLVASGVRVTSCRVHKDYLWLGFSSGKLMIVDLGCREIVAEWKAHQVAINLLHSPQSGRNPMYVPMVSVCESGCAMIWDANCTQLTLSNSLLSRIPDYCKPSNVHIKVCSWNVDSQRPPDDDKVWEDWLGLEQQLCDIYLVGLQEIMNLESKSANAKLLLQNNSQKSSVDEARAQVWYDRIYHCLQNRMPGILRLAGESMVGLLLAVFVNSESLSAHRIKNVSCEQVKTGLGGLHGNKGALVARMIIDDSSLCLVNCHLTAGHSQASARNADLSNIFKSAALKHVTAPLGTFRIANSVGEAILDHEHTILLGDLNYRLNITREAAEEGCIKRAYQNLIEEHDQLRHQKGQCLFHPLATFTEADVTFAPTYKYDRGTDRFDTSEKQRVPAYCDRILLRSSDPSATISHFRSHPAMRISDHQPVSATISLQVKEIDAIKQALLKCELQRELILRLSRS